MIAGCGDLVVFDYAAAAVSCCMNGRRVRGISQVVGTDGVGWLALSNGQRVRRDEIALVGTHPFTPHESGYGCATCGFNETAEVHAEPHAAARSVGRDSE